MAIERRKADRRRRVLYSAHQADNATGTVSRREVERLREARRPSAAYGSRVHRRLRARWFSLVPVRRASLTMLCVALGVMAAILCVAHVASVAWPAIAYRPEIARPLRLDRPDSFGRWVMVAMLTLSSGVSLLIYQLRRHRNDDFAGRYRLWRTVLTVTLLASVNSLVSLIDWAGALMDVAFGRRVALTGSDWVRLVVTFGGVILSLQMIAEMRRCRFAVSALVLAIGCFTLPELANWNVLEIDSLLRWGAVTSAPLFGCTALFIALGGYLRMLYREVRKIEDSVSLRERIEKMRPRIFSRSEEEDEIVDEKKAAAKADVEAEQPRRRWWKRIVTERPTKQATASSKQTKEKEKEAEEEWEDEDVDNGQVEQRDAISNAKSSDSKPSREKRRWFGRRAKPIVATDGTEATDDSSDKAPKEKRSWFRRRVKQPSDRIETEGAEESSGKPAKKKRGLSMRLKPPGRSEEAAKTETVPRVDDESGGEETGGRRGLSWFRRKPREESHDETEKASAKPPSPSKSSQAASSDSEQSDDSIDPNDIDWNGLSKSERRRLRRQLKRDNRAA